MGTDVTANGTESFAFGHGSKAYSPFSLSIGEDSEVYGYASMGIGQGANVYDDYSYTFGTGSTHGKYSYTFGTGDNHGDNAYLFGKGSQVYSDYGTVMGQEMAVNGTNSFGISLKDNNLAKLSQDNTLGILGGKVGINTLMPKSTLTVNGTIEADALNITCDTGNKVYMGCGMKMCFNANCSNYQCRNCSNGIFMVVNEQSDMVCE